MKQYIKQVNSDAQITSIRKTISRRFKTVQAPRSKFGFILLFVCFAWMPSAFAQNTNQRITSATQGEVATDQIIVKYKSNLRQNRLRQLPQNAMNAITSRANSPLVYLRQMRNGAHILKLNKFQSASDVQVITEQIKSDPNIEYAEPDLILQTTFEPNDPYYSQYQWHYNEIDGGINLPQAWDITSGENVTVAVIDTGYLPHADLIANLLPGYDMISDTFISRDGDGRDADATDVGDWMLAGECGNGQPAQNVNSSWHGTHVMGTIAAESNNSVGVAGVAYGAKVVPVRALGRCGGYTSDISDAIVWAAGGTVSGVPTNANPAQVLNLSFGGQGYCGLTFQNAINTANSLGATIVVAAGNSNADASSFTPANCNNVVTVAATERNGARSYYSNYGSAVDVAAPGGDATVNGGLDGVLSTFNNGQTIANADAYGFYQGTSMAAPHVSGVAALLYSDNPNITPAEVEQRIKNTARSFPGNCSQCGTGIVDAYAALNNDTGSGGESSELENGVEISGLNGSTGEELRFSFTVPEGATNLSFALTGGTGDADLYVSFENNPTPTIFECGSYLLGSNESCLISEAQEGTYHVLVHGYSDFSNVSIVASYDEASENVETFSANNLSGFWFSWAYFYVEIPEGATGLTINTFGGTGDVDLYLQHASFPNASNYACSSVSSTTVDSCTINNPPQGTWYIGLRSGFFYSGATLSVQYTY